MNTDPWVALDIHAWSVFARHLKRASEAEHGRWRRIWQRFEHVPPSAWQQGPICNSYKDLTVLDCQLLAPDYTVLHHAKSETKVNLMTTSAKDLRTFLKQMCQKEFLRDAEQRPRLAGVIDLKMDRSTKLLSTMRPSDPLRGPFLWMDSPLSADIIRQE